MGDHLARLCLAFVVGGCSILYNPTNITSDASLVDVEVRADANPGAIDILDLFPPTIDEGSGLGNSRAAIVVVHGHQFVAAANPTVTLTPSVADAVHLDAFEMSGNGDYIALVISTKILTDAECPGGSVPIHIEVAQDDGAGGRASKAIDALAMTCLPELTTAPTSATNLAALYSKIDIPAGINFPAAEANKAILKSASYINLGPLDGSATGANPGPGGSKGGPAAMAGNGLRPGGGGGIGAGGGGGGFVVAGEAGGNVLTVQGGAGGGTTGDSWIATYGTNGSSGGGGGGGGTGVGGGGGGTLELTASGDITVGAITADGGAGADGGAAGGAGGAGTGGVVLVRTGATVSVASISAAAGAKTGNGGASSVGRVRIDAAKGGYPMGSATKGPMFVDVPAKTAVQKTTLSLRGTKNDASATLRVYDKMENVVPGGPYPVVFSNTDPATADVVDVTLKAGFNKVCVWVDGGAVDVDESVNCVRIAYLPP